MRSKAVATLPAHIATSIPSRLHPPTHTLSVLGSSFRKRPRKGSGAQPNFLAAASMSRMRVSVPDVKSQLRQ